MLFAAEPVVLTSGSTFSPITVVGSTPQSGTTNPTFAFPAGIQNGDICIVIFERTGGSITTSSISSGWTLQLNTSSPDQIVIASAVYAAGLVAPTVTLGTSVYGYAGAMIALRSTNGSLTNNPTTTSATGTAITGPTVTPSADNAAVLVCVSSRYGSNTTITLTDSTQIFTQQLNISGVYIRCTVGIAIQTTKSSYTAHATLSASNQWQCVQPIMLHS